MRRSTARDASRWSAARLLTVGVALASAAWLANAVPSAWRAECVGYYTMQLPGDIEYAVQRPPLERSWNAKFSDGLGAWGTRFSVGLDSDIVELNDIGISSEASEEALKALANARNEALQRERDERLRMADRSDDSPAMQRRLRREAGEISFYESLNSGTVFARHGSKGIRLVTLVNNRIVDVGLNLVGTPGKTIDGFLGRIDARALFEVPARAGVCLPYAFVNAETQPASVGISMRLKDRPDIVIYLHDGKDLSAFEPPKSAKAYLSKAVHNSFYGAKIANPLDGDFKPFHDITIDGRQGLGGFALLVRDRLPGSEAFNNAANKDQDWGYLAYVPRDESQPPGMSSELVFKVERFGRFAKQPMSEKEFRELVKNLAAGIKRRPGAWAPR